MLWLKKILQMLKESFGTFEGASLVGRQSFEKEKKKKVQVNHAWAIELQLTKMSKVHPGLVECFFCKKLGYWKRNYPIYLASLDLNRLMKRNQQIIMGQDTYMITPYNFSICDTTIWVLDTESSIHICNLL